MQSYEKYENGSTTANQYHPVVDRFNQYQYYHILSLCGLNPETSNYWRSNVFSKILRLRFPKTEVQKPIVCYLAKDFDLTFNILNAGILPRKEGFMVLELTGTKNKFKHGVEYLKRQGVKVQNAAHEVSRSDEKCTHCGSCTAVCPTAALCVQRPEMAVLFDKDKCSACELCVAACPAQAMEVRFNKSLLT